MDRETRRVLKTGWLGQVSPVLSDAFLDAGHLRAYPDGATIYGLGSDCCFLWGIAAGLVRMWVTMNEQEPRFGHVAGPGSWFGENEVITGQPRIIEMEAAGETCVCIVTREDIQSIARRHPEAWHAIALLAVMNQSTAIGAADDLMLRNAKNRLVAVLLRLSSHRNAYQGAAPIAKIPAAQAEIAVAANLSRSSAAAILAELSCEGLIRTDYRWVAILEPERLSAMLAE